MTAQLLHHNHRIEAGDFTLPGGPGPAWVPFRSREQSRQISGTDFEIDRAGPPVTAVADLPDWPVRAYALTP